MIGQHLHYTLLCYHFISKKIYINPELLVIKRNWMGIVFKPILNCEIHRVRNMGVFSNSY